MRTFRLLLGALCLLLAYTPTVHAKGPLFFEEVLLDDAAEDFRHGALDIESVYVSEVYPFDPDTDDASDRVVLRIEPRALNEMSGCQVPSSQEGFTTLCQMRLDVHFDAAGATHHMWAVLDPPGRGSCCPVSAANTSVHADGTSIRMSLDRPALRLFPGTTIDRLYVTSALIAGGQTQAADRAPGDNQGAPYDSKPDLEGSFAASYTLQGTYEFFTLDVEDGPHRNSVAGRAVDFDVNVAPTAGVKDDTIRFTFDVPAAWSLTPSRGTTGVEPRGLITGFSEGMEAQMGLQVTARDLVESGEVYTILVHAYSSSQGYVLQPLTVRVTGSTIEDPDYVFHWRQAPALRAGQEGVFLFEVRDATGAPRAALPIDVTFGKDGQSVSVVPATAQDQGYRVAYTFPSAGAWSVEARVMSLQPSPHAVITVDIEASASSTSGLGAPWLLAVVAGLGLLKGRSTRRP